MPSSEINDAKVDFLSIIQRIAQGVQAVVLGFTEFVNRPEVRAFITLVHEHPQRLREKIALRRRLLRRGLVPSNVILRWAGRLREINPQDVAREYANVLRSRGSNQFADVMESLADVAALGHHGHTLSAIFPEVERVSRNHIYEPGTRFGITGIPSARLAVSTLLVDRTFTDSLAALELDHFVLTLVDAVDFAYLNDHDAEHRAIMKRYARVFRTVPNRHHVCHGMDAIYGPAHVINAMTVLYTVMAVAEHMVSMGLTVSEQWQDGKKEFHRLREERRKFNMINLAIAYKSQKSAP